MTRKLALVGLLVMLSSTLIVGAAPGFVPDEVLVRYPQGYTKVLMADLRTILEDPALSGALLGPLMAAHQPLGGIAQIIELLELDPSTVEFVAHGTGPGLTPFSLIQGPPQEATMGALMGLQFAVGAPNSPYTNWDLIVSHGLPVVRVGGVFGPIQIQWAYIPTSNALWIGTEVGFGGEPDVERLMASVEAVTARIQGQGPYFDELPTALSVRGGDIAFVRRTDLSVDRPAAPGEEAFGFALNFTPQGALARFAIRFSSVQAAQEALEALQAGQSPYLAQDLYAGQLVEAQLRGRELVFTVSVDFKGLVGLLLVVMPS